MKKQEQESKEDDTKAVSVQPPMPPPAPTVPPAGAAAQVGVAETKYIVMDDMGNQSVVDFGGDKVRFLKWYFVKITTRSLDRR